MSAAQSTEKPLDPWQNHSSTGEIRKKDLLEEFVWTAGDVTVKRADRSHYSWAKTGLRLEHHIFRGHFDLQSVPQFGTLFIAGPRYAKVFLNGKLLGSNSTNPEAPINFRVFHFDVGTALRKGDNVLAVEAIRGRGVVTGAGSEALHQFGYGEVFAAKLLAGRFGNDDAPPLVVTNSTWRSIAEPKKDDWQSPAFDDSAWPRVESLGSIDGNIEFRQWSVDAGMYGWPGYTGMSSFLRAIPIAAVRVTRTYDGEGQLQHVEAITQEHAVAPFTVELTAPHPTDEQAPAMLVDFGKEIAGRLVIDSGSDQDATLSIAYGEDEMEAMATGLTPGQRGGNYLGTNLLDVPANGRARGPKSAFRYVRITFLRGAPRIPFRSIHAEAITYPVKYEGGFESSDARLNRIFATAAYTAHLCMQDDIWDAPKRDRGRWAGDLDVEAGTILGVFGDTFALEDTLRHLADDTAPGQAVNGIGGYTAQWITTLAKVYEASGDVAYVRSEHDALRKLLATMDGSLDAQTGLLRRDSKGWGFVDWAPGLYGATDDTFRGSTLEFLRAYEAAPALLRAAGDEAAAKQYEQRAQTMREAARKTFLDLVTHTVGTTWQINSMAVLTNLAPEDNDAIWSQVLAHVKQDTPQDQVISPYFNAYVLDAMSATGHQRTALDWIRTYWGGMLDEGATSFWESYDLRWPKSDPHLSLQADGTSGYFVSYAHGWASWPAPWLQQNVLGVRATSPGYASVDVHPNLLGLEYAHGSVATPHGPIAVSLDHAKAWTMDLPAGIERARVFLPGKSEPAILTHSGHYEFAQP
ncbi:alpha-L-rhamnosidase [Bryocella elongata]|uniref:Alpha-L-rhamnosidase n=1 Tax=Bryocella elongata TaxID=863522 RepID=A0A1H6AY22_9BACT|nr:alpha-L-rhamnosidase [Bryocella elongata]